MQNTEVNSNAVLALTAADFNLILKCYFLEWCETGKLSECYLRCLIYNLSVLQLIKH